jgi:hypothetical protein
MDLQDAHTRCKTHLVRAIEQLQGKVEPTQLETITELIVQTMTGPWRYFHTPSIFLRLVDRSMPLKS